MLHHVLKKQNRLDVRGLESNVEDVKRENAQLKSDLARRRGEYLDAQRRYGDMKRENGKLLEEIVKLTSLAQECRSNYHEWLSAESGRSPEDHSGDIDMGEADEGEIEGPTS